ncbi:MULTISPECIES: ATP-binding protein [Streptomyces]|uniref:ATP-binding protein n=1 Tax=Streptomyces caniscabiei TaxID=2746961 RepID=A0ABU4MS99_9ACTN|nr:MULTISPECIES: ATP-binding protein [Streptomyces]MBE4737426.1 ATP-binding protein [Streptomyces caniscabiei]MBE4756186.1 ATP-binding protein [Streptomyces caniscabiei]MBE4769797.1 ATP-binding protein [Streptomyces caniscabiei]MBE4787257.1 ATP-binding protein [Streptomyces caniscabiei]MBE4795338.1 ATP-binding protein [Streptomyces caniscabiei]
MTSMERQPLVHHDTAPADGPAARPPGPPVAITNAAAARRHVRAFVGERWRSPAGPPTEQSMIDLILVVSELVTNAVRHGGGLAGFDVALTPEGVRLAVRDHSAAVPVGLHGPGALPRAHEGNGYGWPLINRLSSKVDVVRRASGGKTISVLVPLA